MDDVTIITNDRGEREARCAYMHRDKPANVTLRASHVFVRASDGAVMIGDGAGLREAGEGRERAMADALIEARPA